MSATTPPDGGVSAVETPEIDGASKPDLRATARREKFDGRRCGFYCYDGVEKVFIQYTIRHRKENAFPMSIGLFHQLDGDTTRIYVVDKDTEDVYRFPREAYEEARTICKEQGESYAPHPVEDSTGYWSDAKEELIPDRPHWV